MRKKKMNAKRKAMAAQENIDSSYARNSTSKAFTGRKDKPKPRKARARPNLSDTHIDYGEKIYLPSAKKYKKLRDTSPVIRDKDGNKVKLCKPFN